MFTLINVIGNLAFVIFNVSLPFSTLSEYRRSPLHPRSALVGSSIMLLLALLAILNWLLVASHSLRIKNPALVSIALLDLTLLVYCWTSPSETWAKRRNNQKSFFVMAAISVIMATACIIMFTQAQL